MSDSSDLSEINHEEDEMFTSSSDEELELWFHRNKRAKNENYLEDTVPLYSEELFIEHFRVSRHVASEIGTRFRNSPYYFRQAGEFGKLDSSDYVLIFLWFCGHEAASYRDVADRFNVSLSSLHKIVKRMTYFLSNLSIEIIKWPNDEEKVTIESFFRENQFPGCIGAIDGTHVKIDKPSEDADSYLNRKNFYSIQAQVVCDHRRKIRDVFVGFPGSVHDSRVFRASPLWENLQDKCGNYFLIGDSGYPCLRNLLTPYRDRGHLHRRQHNYNTKLCKNRYLIEHCFGILKQKFRQLYHLKLRKIEDIVHFIRACCVLHNLAIDDEFPFQNDILEQGVPGINMDHIEELDDRDGMQMRDNVAHHLPL